MSNRTEVQPLPALVAPKRDGLETYRYPRTVLFKGVVRYVYVGDQLVARLG
jgi:hypothetical protein